MATKNLLFGCLVLLVLASTTSAATNLDLKPPTQYIGGFPDWISDSPGNGERNIVFDALTTFSISSAGIEFAPLSPYGTTQITVQIWEVTKNGAYYGTGARGNLLATGSAPVASFSSTPVFYDVPISFTFQAGVRYAIGFSAAGLGWNDHIVNGSSYNHMRFYRFDPDAAEFWPGMPPWAPFQVGGLVSVLDGGFDTDFHNQGFPHVQLNVSTDVVLPEVLYNGITMPFQWPPLRQPTQQPEVPSYLTSPPPVIPIDVGRQLFVDDFLIDNTTLTRTPHRPSMYPGNPLLTPGPSDTRNLAMPYSDGVWYDPSDSLFKLFYLGGGGSAICYAYSADGVNWIKPAIPDAAVPGTNIVISIGTGRDSATVWMDLGDDPSRKFKAFAYTGGNKQKVWFSADGIHWTQQPNVLESLSDRTTFFYNPFRKVWVTSARMSVTLPEYLNYPQHYTRARFYLESPNLSSWKPTDPTATFWTGPDVNDPPYYNVAGAALPELYNLDATPYESLMVGMFSWFNPGPSYNSNYGPGPDIVELGVGFSRDGFQWVRPTRGSGTAAFIPATNNDGDWNAANTQSAGGGFLVVGDELWFYFSGRTMHKPADGLGSTGLAKLRRDGFYSMDAGSGEGTLTTRPVAFSGKYVFVNVDDPGGNLRVEILNNQGQVIVPYSKANCLPIAADKTLKQVVWSGASDVSALSGQPVKFRFYLTNGKLYSFWVTSDAAGASHGYVAAGGPGFTSQIDTTGAQLQATAPILYPPGGTFTASVSVSMSSLTAGAIIRYTIDGSTPNSLSMLYSGPINVTSTTTIKTKAFVTGAGESDVATGVYTVVPAVPTITAVASNAIASSSATITWTTDSPSDSAVEYGTSSAYGSLAVDSRLVTSHSQDLSALTGNTTYHYRVKSKGTTGNAATSPDYSFTTLTPPDTTSPQIGSVTISGITQIGATVSWTTNEPATSRVEYGLPPAYDKQTTLDATLVTSHSVVLSGLTPATTYHLHALSADAAGNAAPSSEQTFATLPAVPGLTTLRINTGGWGADVPDANGNWWGTDRYCSGGEVLYNGNINGNPVEFPINATGRQGYDFSYHIPVASGTYNVTLRFADLKYDNAGLRYFNAFINGQQVLANFDVVAAIGYHQAGSRTFTATATSQGYLDISFKGVINTAIVNGIEVVPAAAQAVAVPSISPASGSYTDSVTVTMISGTTGAVIRYTTNNSDPTSSSAQYSGPIIFTSSVTIKAKAFAAGLLDSPIASASYAVVARDVAPPSITALTIGNIKDTSATVTWTTNEPATSRVEYGLPPAYDKQTTLDATLVTSHSVVLSGLTPATTYHLHALSADAAGNAAPSSEQTFATLPAVAGLTTLRINSGGWGEDVPDANGNWWSTDRYCSGGEVLYNGNINGNPVEFPINATGRQGYDFSYHIPVASGTYNVTLRFADLRYDNAGLRYFNAFINGQQVLANFDVVAAIGYHQAGSRTFTATATSQGYLDISFKGVINTAIVNGIEVVPAAAQAVAVPSISPASGSYTDSVTVTMISGTTGAVIRYTTNNSDPTSSSAQYSGPIIFTSSVTIKAKAFAAGLLDSPIASASYAVVARDVAPPSITALTIGNIKDTSATVTWTTNEPATSRVEYGLPPAYDKQTTLDATLVTSHSVVLSGLTPATTYHLHALSADAAGNAAPSSEQTFATLPAVAGLTTLRINSGGWGEDVPDANGNWWSTDRYCSGGEVLYNGNINGNPVEFPINATGRQGYDFSYHIPVASGTYNVTLRFADLRYDNAGLRYFNTFINGQQVLTNFDVVAAIGYHQVGSRTFTATATSQGYLDISFKGVINTAIVNSIEVVPAR